MIGLRELPYWSHYSKARLLLHTVVSSKYFDLSIAGVIGLNVITMALEFHMMPEVRRDTSTQLNDASLSLSLIYHYDEQPEEAFLANDFELC